MKHLMDHPKFIDDLHDLATGSPSFDDLDHFEDKYGVSVDLLGEHYTDLEVTVPDSSDRIATVRRSVLPDDYVTSARIYWGTRIVYQTGEDRERFVEDGFDDIHLFFDEAQESEFVWEPS
tara:strand:+ start:574 stop:933 length:360 start_codon:yes stop_codon:yes gene_type:complete